MTDNSKARPNAGQGVKVLAAGAVLMLFLGIIYVWSVFVKPVSEAMNGWDIAEVKLTASFMLSCFATAILIGGKLFMRYGARKVVLAGGLMMATGMLVSSFVSPGAAWLIYITYGAVSGFGSGLAYSTILSAAQKWFPHKRGLATGIIVGAFGFSTVIFAPLVEYLIAAFGVSASFRILAAVFCAATLLLFRLITLPPEPAAPPPDASPDPAAQRQYAPSEILRTSSFYMITVSLMFGTAAYFILNPSFVTLANERGAASVATMIVMMTGIANAIGRLTVPLFSDKFGREAAAIMILIVTAICSGLLVFSTGALFMVAIAFNAACYGGYSGIYPVITGEYFGLKNVGANYGAVMVGWAICALFLPMIMTLVPSMTVKFVSLAIMALIGAFLVVILFLRKRAASRAT